MAHLTKYNLSQLCKKLEINNEISLELFVEHIINDPKIYFILNKSEVRFLFIYKMLLSDEQKFVVEYYDEVPEKEDTKEFVFDKGGKMKYHLTSECKLLKKDYLDFNIIDEIKCLGEEAIIEYREWFVNNRFAEKFIAKEIDKQFIIRQFNLKYVSKYKFEPLDENSSLLIVERLNSNNEYVQDSFNMEDFLKTIEDLKMQWSNSFQCKTSRTFAKFNYLISKSDEEIKSKMADVFSESFADNYGLDNLKQKFKKAKDIKFSLISELLNYIKWTYKLSEKNFDVLTLERFGLVCCHSCLKDKEP